MKLYSFLFIYIFCHMGQEKESSLFLTCCHFYVLGFSENHTLGNNRSQLVIYCGLKPNLQSIFYGNLPFVFTGWYIELCTLYTMMSVIKNVFKHISPLSDLIISVCPFQLCCFRVKSMCVNLKAMTPRPTLYESVIKTLNLLPSHWSHASK